MRNEAAAVMKKTYFGGGTVSVSLPSQRFHVSRSSLSERSVVQGHTGFPQSGKSQGKMNFVQGQGKVREF